MQGHHKCSKQIPKIDPVLLGQMTGPILMLLETRLCERTMSHQACNAIVRHDPGTEAIPNCPYTERSYRSRHVHRSLLGQDDTGERLMLRKQLAGRFNTSLEIGKLLRPWIGSTHIGLKIAGSIRFGSRGHRTP